MVSGAGGQEQARNGDQASGTGSREIHQRTSPKVFHFDALLTSRGEYLWLAVTRRSALGEALEARYLEAKVAMRNDGDLLIELVAVGDGGVDEDEGPGGNDGKHGVAGHMHADHVFRVRTPGKRSEEHVFDFGLGEAHILGRATRSPKAVTFRRGMATTLALPVSWLEVFWWYKVEVFRNLRIEEGAWRRLASGSSAVSMPARSQK